MPRTIRVLPDSVANQIAAGEVVERPASVVKELVENAFDAGAREIRVQLVQGGKRVVRVSDDGRGMGREDAILSLDRHATSKIRSADDLRAVETFGFRGEALPAIASVSRMTLETRVREEEVGTRIVARGGAITAVEDVARTPGTTVTVENLFFNAPARAKFLRQPAAETRAVTEALAPLALAHPEVAIHLDSDERPLLELPAVADVVERIGAIWGAEAAADLLPVAFRDGDFAIHGVVQRPDATKPGFRRSYLFLGDRPFREPVLLRAADRGYRTTIPREHRPWVFLFLDAPRGGVDVNVHPTKAEVRFRDRAAVEGLVERGVRGALETLESAATFGTGTVPTLLRVRERRPEGTPAEAQMALFLAGGVQRPSHTERAAGKMEPGAEGGAAQEATGGDGAESPRLWQVHDAWILAEVRDGLLLIDQHAAHERVLFERIMAGFGAGGMEGQRLLFPLTVRLTLAEYAIVEELGGLLRRTGFEVEGFGGDTVIVHAVPHPHPHFDAERCLREMIDELTRGSELTRAARNQHERVAMSFACKGAIKAGQPLSDSEVQELFDALFATELPFHDVHGRPTTVRLSRGEIERKFGR
ncbi:MAG: DNA mismatch repair endonuclease MutL [Gemmatimonadota bacterium]